MADLVGFVQKEAADRFKRLGIEPVNVRRLLKISVVSGLDGFERILDLEAACRAADPEGYVRKHLDLVVADARLVLGLAGPDEKAPCG